MARKLVCGVGEYAAGKYTATDDGKITKGYALWSGMINRCYNDSIQKNQPTYIGCAVSKEFKNFQKFMCWVEKQAGFGLQGWQLDKDLLIGGNKLYSADTCVFVPKEINLLLTSRRAKRGRLPIGVCRQDRGFTAHCNKGVGRPVYMGFYPTAELAFAAYKAAKELYIKEIANEYRDQIDPRAYDALMAYEVNIDD